MKVENSDSVTKKLSALTSGDDASYEEAIKLLEKRRTYYSGKNGEVERLTAQENDCKYEKEEAENAQRRLIAAKSDYCAAEKRLAAAKNEELRLAAELNTLRAYGQRKEILLSGKTASERKNREILNREERKKELAECRGRLSESLCTKENLHELADGARDYRRLYETENAPDKDVADDPVFAAFARDGLPSEEEINAHIGERSRADALDLQANEKKAGVSDLPGGRTPAQAPGRRAGTRNLFVCLDILGLLSVLAGAILYFATPAHRTAAIILIAAGASALAIGTVGALNAAKSAKKYALHMEERAKKIAEIEKEALGYRASCESFAEKYGVAPDRIECLFSLRAQYAAKCAKEKENAETSALLSEKLRNALGKYLEDPLIGDSPEVFDRALIAAGNDLKAEKDHSDEIERIGDRIADYDRDVSAALLKLSPDGGVSSDFDFDKALSEISELTDPEREKALFDKLGVARSEIDCTNGDLGRLAERIRFEDERADKLPELENDYDFIRQKRESAEKSLELIKKTEELLGKAKIKLSGAYLGGMETEFKEIFEKIVGTEENVRIDAKFGVRIERSGQGREAANFSRGYQCVMGFAMRLALVRTIYCDREAPIFLMDDPFAGLDDRRFGAMKKVVKDLADEYQILYFTCTSGRNLQ